MYASEQNVKSAPREATLNDRLNRVAEALHHNCGRIETVLSRINGTPPTPTTKGADSVARISPTHAMTQVLDQLEETSQRLANLASNVEQVA